MNINSDFKQRVKEYFAEETNEFIKKLSEPCTHGFFVNTTKASKDTILSLVDFEYKESLLNPNAYYHSYDSIGKSKAHVLGLIYPQDVESSLFTNFLKALNPKLIVDMCAAPGGKTINVLNAFSNAICISNDVNLKRTNELANNLERLGLDNTIITNKNTKELSNALIGNADLVLLDAPCSGEGMIRKYNEILDTYSVDNICNLSNIQKDLLEDAFKMLKKDGVLVYSTCTYALEEDENQISNFLLRHSDARLIKISNTFNYSKLDGTIKLCPLNNTEGQFISIIVRDSYNEQVKLKESKTINNKIVEDFIVDNIDISNYYLYKDGDSFYLSLTPLYDLKNNVIRKGIYIGKVIKNRFEPSHNLYRSNSLSKYFKYRYDLSNDEYKMFINGNELQVNLENNYYLVTYKGFSLGYGKVSNKTLKNKYPKGLRGK